MIYKYILLTFISFTFIYACSKNDSSENKSCGGTALSLNNSSYENFKAIDHTPQTHPNGVGRDAVAYADFNQDGLLDMFVATLTFCRLPLKKQQLEVILNFILRNVMVILKNLMNILHQVKLVFIQEKH